MPQSTTCSKCNRVVYVSDVDTSGRCCDCIEGKSASLEATLQRIAAGDITYAVVKNGVVQDEEK